jgi:hypothetical protein
MGTIRRLSWPSPLIAAIFPMATDRTIRAIRTHCSGIEWALRYSVLNHRSRGALPGHGHVTGIYLGPGCRWCVVLSRVFSVAVTCSRSVEIIATLSWLVWRVAPGSKHVGFDVYGWSRLVLLGIIDFAQVAGFSYLPSLPPLPLHIFLIQCLLSLHSPRRPCSVSAWG